MKRHWHAIDAGSAVLSAVASLFVAPIAFVLLMSGLDFLMTGFKLPFSEMVAITLLVSAFSVPFGIPFVATWWFCLTAIMLIFQIFLQIRLPIVLLSSIAVSIVLMLVMPFAKWYGIRTSNDIFAVMAGAATFAGFAYWIVNSLPASSEEV